MLLKLCMHCTFSNCIANFPCIYVAINIKIHETTSYNSRAGGMSSQLVQPNLTMRTMQLNAWVADNFINIEILFLPLVL